MTSLSPKQILAKELEILQQAQGALYALAKLAKDQGCLFEAQRVDASIEMIDATLSARCAKTARDTLKRVQ
jgi:hypothetical protein